MGRRNQHSREELQDLVLQTAEQILDEQGSAALSTRKIAGEIGYSAGTLYWVFENRDDLCLQINGRTLQTLGERLQEAVSGEGSPQERITALGLAYFTFARQWPERWRLLFEHRLPEGEAEPDWLSLRIHGLFALVEAELRRLDPEAKQPAVHQGGRALWSAVHGVCALADSNKLMLESTTGEKGLITSLIDLYLQGWEARTGLSWV